MNDIVRTHRNRPTPARRRRRAGAALSAQPLWSLRRCPFRPLRRLLAAEAQHRPHRLRRHGLRRPRSRTAAAKDVAWPRPASIGSLN